MISDFYAKYPQVNDEILNLDWVINKIKSMDTMLTEWLAEAEELRQIIANTIPGMQDDISTLYGDINTIEASILNLRTSIADLPTIRNDIAGLKQIDKELQEQINKINTNYSEIFAMFDNIYYRLDHISEIVGAELMARIYKLQEEFYIMKADLENQMKEISDRMDAIDTSVYNPWAGYRVDQDTNDKMIYRDLADMVPTASEYAGLGLSADDYDDYEINAYEYAVRGKKHFHFDWCFSPLWGIRQAVGNVLTSIINYMMGTLTATEYSALDLDADAYSNLDLTAEAYYTYNVNGSGLTADDYSAISHLNSGLLIS